MIKHYDYVIHCKYQMLNHIKTVLIVKVNK